MKPAKLFFVALAVSRCTHGLLFKKKLFRPLRPKRCRRRRRRVTPLNPLGLYLGVMGAPVYGRDLLPFLGGLVDFETLEPRDSPNEYLSAPADAAPAFVSADKRQNATVYPVSVTALKDAFEKMLADRQPVAGELFAKPTLADVASSRYTYVERTPLLRFPDVINVQFLEAGEDSSTLVLHSASVYGYDDLGKNKQRVTEMLAALNDLPRAMTASAVSV